jgi:hypothetical protein
MKTFKKKFKIKKEKKTKKWMLSMPNFFQLKNRRKWKKRGKL